MKLYEVAIVYRGQDNYLVESESENNAVEVATEMYKNCEKPDILGNEWEEIEKVVVREVDE